MGKCEIQRHRDQHRVDIFAGQQLTVIFVRRGVVSGGLDALLQVDVPVVAHRDAAAGIRFVKVLEQIIAAASGSDKAVLDLLVGGADFLDERSALNGGQRGGDGCNGTGCLYEIAAGDIGVLCHVASLFRRDFHKNCNTRSAGAYLSALP